MVRGCGVSGFRVSGSGSRGFGVSGLGSGFGRLGVSGSGSRVEALEDCRAWGRKEPWRKASFVTLKENGCGF